MAVCVQRGRRGSGQGGAAGEALQPGRAPHGFFPDQLASEAAPNAPPLREVPRVGKLEARAETLSQGRAVHQTGSFSQS